MQILASASKHGVSNDDTRHAVANAITAITNPEQPDFVVLIGRAVPPSSSKSVF